MANQIKNEERILKSSLNQIGKNDSLRLKFTNFLQEIEVELKNEDKNARETIIGPIMNELYKDSGILKKEITGGLLFNFLYNSKIAREFLLSDKTLPDHVWEPQTTKVLQYFSKGVKNVLVGGAFFGDQAIIIANEVKKNGGFCHAFEPNIRQFDMLRRNAIDNNLENLIINQKALWNKSDLKLLLDPLGMEDEGNWGLSNSSKNYVNTDNSVDTITISDYCNEKNIKSLDLIMLDIEGGEYSVLNGALDLLNQNEESAPVLVFEVHSKYTDWKNGFDNVEIIKQLKGFGYKVYAIRDYHSNKDMFNTPIELIPSDSIYLDGPHHGFNVLAVKNKNKLDKGDFTFVKNVSPKYLDHKDPKIHQPLFKK
jgi:FkbM family methyltransferase